MSDKTNGDYVLVPRGIVGAARKILSRTVHGAHYQNADLLRVSDGLKDALMKPAAPAGGVDDGLLKDLNDIVEWLGTLHALHPKPTHLEVNLARFAVTNAIKALQTLPRPAFDEAEAREILAQVLRDRHVYGENKAVSLMNGAVIPINTNDALDFARRMSTHHSRDGVIEALRSALVRTQANFDLAVRGKPVRDMAENLAENFAALELADRAQSQQKKQG